MIWELIEYIVFVSNKVHTRLTADAEIHLHIARRGFEIPRNDELKAEYESLGYKVGSDLRKDSYFVSSSLHQSDIPMLFRQAMRQRWSNSRRKLAEVTLERMDYAIPDQTAPALFLADIILGAERKRIQQANSINIPQVFPILEALDYGKELNTVIQCKSYIASGNTDGLLGELEKAPFNPDDLQNQDIVNTLVALYKKDKEPFQRHYETAVKYVDYENRCHHLSPFQGIGKYLVVPEKVIWCYKFWAYLVAI
jgi:hypothetical protein